MEGHDAVGRVADEDSLIAIAPTLASNGRHLTDWAVEEVGGEVGDEFDEVREFGAEELGDLGRLIERREAIGSSSRVGGTPWR